MRLFSKTYPSTLSRLGQSSRARKIETWTFDDQATRKEAEANFAALGLKARCRSAYKPLVCAFREEIDTQGLIRAEIIYPRHPAAAENRFLLESYPLSALYPKVSFVFVAGPIADALPVYRCILTYDDNRCKVMEVIAPNRLHQDYSANQALSPCGWVIEDGRSGAIVTEYERLFHDTMAAIEAAPWQQEPYFPELNISVTLPAKDESLGYGQEVLSLSEALHEEFYFSLMEMFQRRSGKPIGARDLRPGQIVPEIGRGDKTSVRVEVRALEASSFSAHMVELDRAPRALSQVQIDRELAKIAGEELRATAVSGRIVKARYHKGNGRSLLISAGQHANETSGPVGSLRAAQELAAKGASFVISPLENPDGYALHQRLIEDNPRHMHHAARYTALGDDLEYRSGERIYEKAIRLAAERACPSLLHVNCHGYPAHEWTRPLSGYSPRSFESWTLPKGFFLILRHREGFAAAARALMEKITLALHQVEGLMAFNQAQLKLFKNHADTAGFEMVNGFAVRITCDDRHNVPMTLITEYPDETLYDAAFIAAHDAQRATVLAAHQALQELDDRLISGAGV